MIEEGFQSAPHEDGSHFERRTPLRLIVDRYRPEKALDAFTYAKLGPFIIVGFIAMARPKQWVGTRVNTHGGTIIGPRDYTMPKEFWEFITVKADRAATLQERISEKQTAKIAETYKANLERAAESDSMRVMHQDVKLFGGRAFRRK